MGTGVPQECAAGGNAVNPSTRGVCTIQHGMAQHGALSAFLELMGWLFQPCGDPSISYRHRSGLLARAFEEGSGVVGGNRVIHQLRRFWMTWQAGCVATPSCWTAGAGL